MRRRYPGRRATPVPPRRSPPPGTTSAGSVYARAASRTGSPSTPPPSSASRSSSSGFGNGSLLFHVGPVGRPGWWGWSWDTLARTRTNLARLPPGCSSPYRGDLTEASLGARLRVLHRCACTTWPARRRAPMPYCGTRHPADTSTAGSMRRKGNGARDPPRRADPTRRLAPAVVGHEVWYRAPPHRPVLRLREGAPTHPRGHGSVPSAWTVQPLDCRARVRVLPSRRVRSAGDAETHYLSRAVVDSWLRHPDVDPTSTYVLRRNGNSWTFGGRRRQSEPT